MHAIFHAFHIPARCIKKIHENLYHPNKTLPGRVKIRIADTKERAIAEEEHCTAEYKAYTDGSGYKGGIGGAVVLTRADEVIETRRAFLGDDSQHTVYEGELTGLILAAYFAKRERRVQRISLFSDNQAAIHAIAKPSARAGQHLVHAFRSQLEQLLRKHSRARVTIRWIRASPPDLLPLMLRKDLSASVSATRQHAMTQLDQMYGRPPLDQ